MNANLALRIHALEGSEAKGSRQDMYQKIKSSRGLRI